MENGSEDLKTKVTLGTASVAIIRPTIIDDSGGSGAEAGSDFCGWRGLYGSDSMDITGREGCSGTTSVGMTLLARMTFVGPDK